MDDGSKVVSSFSETRRSGFDLVDELDSVCLDLLESSLNSTHGLESISSHDSSHSELFKELLKWRKHEQWLHQQTSEQDSLLNVGSGSSIENDFDEESLHNHIEQLQRKLLSLSLKKSSDDIFICR